MVRVIAVILTLAAKPAFSSPCADENYVDSSYARALQLYIDDRSNEALLQLQAIERCDPGNELVRNAARRIANEIEGHGTPRKRAVGAPPPDQGGKALASEGEKFYRSFNCAHCHSLKGTGGAIGPKLDEALRKLSVRKIQRHLRNPKIDQSDSRMPNLKLRPSEVTALMAYLVSIRDKK